MPVRRNDKRLIVVAVVLVVALLGAGLLLWTALQDRGSPAAGPPCRAGQSEQYTLDLEQAKNATTIAAVGKRLGMPDRAVTIALATAYLESGLRNLAHGDRDSLGLFQQRPSQGWGTPAQIMTPHLSATSFYRRLARVRGWQVMPITEAAQSVQRSAVPLGYAQFEPKARILASALVGETPASFACRVSITKGVPAVGLEQAMSQEVGLRSLAAPLPRAKGWTVASWLIGHSATFKIAGLSFDGRRWTAESGRWTPDPNAGSVVQVVLTSTGVD